ncbi:Csu type fimbrial protein [Halomonas caseinilytica]|uniref:Spore coat protein U (SCPU) domain-containing protein n=1 Tax=Halomonas caseinilytica TaxID=438744 RepID=A0A1M6SK66_9GAMM|nr:spore coat protein U domain-containing protein [Halomonas caseinilytica]SHK45050.1 Spore coat protein U (SCPU) domain-containing protein [Halomonas caseinilytica]
MKTSRCSYVTGLLLLSVASVSMAQTPSSNEAVLNVKVTMELTPACEFLAGGGAGSGEGNVNLGTMDFGSFYPQDAKRTTQLSGGEAGNGISVKCATGVDASVLLQSSLNTVQAGVSATRVMMDGEGNSIGYDVYNEVSMSTPLQDGDVIATVKGDGGAQSIPLYGMANITHDTEAGEYSDTLYITIEI